MLNLYSLVPRLSALVVVALICTTQSHAQTPSVTPIVAIVDIDQVRTRSTAFRSLSDQMKRYTEQFDGQRKTLEQQLAAQEQELAGQRTALSQEVFNQRRQEFANRLREADAALRNRMRSLAQANQQALGQIDQRIAQIVKDIANERGYNLVLVGKAVIVMDTTMDITPDVLAALDRALPTVTVSLAQ